MSKSLLCLDVGSQSVHLVHGRYQKGNIEVRNAVNRPIPEGVFHDGRIEDFESLKLNIRGLLSENKIKEKETVLTTQSTSIITRDLVLPTAERKQLDSMVKYEIEQYLPIVATEYIIEYSVSGMIKEDGTDKLKIQVAAMPKNMVENFINLIKESGLKPIALDLHFNTVAKLFSQRISVNRAGFSPEKTQAFIDLGHHSIAIHILSNGKLAFSRIINLGSREIDNEVSIACNMTLEQAEKEKIKEADLDPENFSELLTNQVNDIIRSQVDVWLSEIQKIFQYYISRTTGNHIDGIYLMGGGSGLKGLHRYVEQSLNLPTKRIDELDIVKLGKDVRAFNPRIYINAMGGLIRYE